mgnify:CR=1 FL=1
MSWRGLTVLAVIPARGGSKSIPRKNLALIDGLSLVAHAARTAASLKWIDQAILSTDDEEIESEGRANGLSVPFRRPPELSGDSANSLDMWRHAWLSSEKTFNKCFDISVLLEPTSPLRQPSDVEATISRLVDGDYDAAVTVSPTPAHFTPHKTLTLKDGVIGYFHPEGSRHSLRQTIPAYYHRNGVCYAVRRKTLIESRRIIDKNCAAVVIDRPVVNIDEPVDLELASLLMAKQTGS